MIQRLTLTLGAWLICLPFANAATLFTIDQFDGDELSLETSDVGEVSGVSDNQASVLGGRREVSLVVTDNSLHRRSTVSINRSGNPLFATALGAQATGQTYIRYTGDSGGGLGGLDFSADRGEVVINLSFLDMPTTITLTYTDTDGLSGSASVSHPGGVFSPESVNIGMDGLIADAGFRLDSVDSLEIALSPNSAGGDVVLSGIEFGQAPPSVPEPTVPAVLLAGVGLAFRRRR